MFEKSGNHLFCLRYYIELPFKHLLKSGSLHRVCNNLASLTTWKVDENLINIRPIHVEIEFEGFGYLSSSYVPMSLY
jgi:hypothetical protein